MIAGDRRVVPRLVVADERRLDVRQLAVRLRAVGIDIELRRSAPALPLRRHLLLEALEVDANPDLRGDLLREFERIAEGVVERERLLPVTIFCPRRRGENARRDARARAPASRGTSTLLPPAAAS